jgi:hypothetical protein
MGESMVLLVQVFLVERSRAQTNVVDRVGV